MHELTHVKRQDNLLLWLLEIFFVAIPVLAIQVFALSFVFDMANSILAILGVLVLLTLCKTFLYKRILFLRELSCDDLSVQAIGNPLVLASSLVNVWRHGRTVPAYRWSLGLAFAQTLLPLRLEPEYRVRRLIDYRRPRFKFLLGKIARLASAGLVILAALFLWKFHAEPRYLFAGWGCEKGLHICSVQYVQE